MQQYPVYILFFFKITLHVSGVIHTHHQEYVKLLLQPLVQVISRWLGKRNKYNSPGYDLYQWL